MEYISERDALISLAHITILGFERLSPLLEYFKSYKSIWLSDPKSWHTLSDSQIKEIQNQKLQIDVQNIHQQNKKLDISLLTILDIEYPDLLKQISSPPLILYYKGDIKLLHSQSLGVVGTRMPSPYGLQAVNQIIPDIVHSGLVITSGFQRGIDTASHKSAIESGGKTVAVLGTGIDVNYPPQNSKLYKELVENGHLIITEYPLQTPALSFNFPRRNRIISGLSLGVLVVEAAIKSGSLITAQFAVEQNREVFAVPGSIFDSTSAGPHHLIQEGAKLVTTAQDILEELNIQKSNLDSNPILSVNLTPIQAKIFAHIEHSSKTIDELIEILPLTITELSSELTELQLTGIIAQMGDGKYVKI